MNADASPADNRTSFQRIASRGRFVARLQTLDPPAFTLNAAVWFIALVKGFIADRWRHNLSSALLVAAMTLCVVQSFRLYDFVVLAPGHDAALACAIAFGPLLGLSLLMPDITDDHIATMGGVVAAELCSVALLRLAVGGQK